MEDGITFIGLDVHVKAIRVASVGPDGVVMDRGEVVNRPAAVLAKLTRLAPAGSLRVCYEAGPTGYSLVRALLAAGIACIVVAPSLIPIKVTDRVKTDRRDAAKLARLLRSGDLQAIAIPSPEQEALRDLARLRQTAVRDLHRQRQRLRKYFSHHGIAEPATGSRWTKGWWCWAKSVDVPHAAAQIALDDLRRTIDHHTERVDALTTALTATVTSGQPDRVAQALQVLHGIGPITAASIQAEVGDLRRFQHPQQLFAYAGLVPSEHSSGARQSRGGITHTGNAHVRYLIVEAAWHYITPIKPRTGNGPKTEVERIAAHARKRLYDRYWRLVSRGKAKQEAIVAIARELLGYLWAVAQVVTPEPQPLAA